jgi:3',5'-cyclic AMP phosphodiesterase CpdA
LSRSQDGFEPLHSWLHLSDIHTGHGGRWRKADQELVLEELVLDIVRNRGRRLPEFTSVYVTGDVAATGAVRSRREYRQFDEWLRGLLHQVDIDSDEVFVVPGNHDVQRESHGDSAHKKIILLRRGGRLDDAMDDAALRGVLKRRQQRFHRWAKNFGSYVHSDQGSLSWRHHRDLPGGVRLRLVGLNTSVLCNNDADRGKLEVGTEQILHGVGNPHGGTNELVVVLGHHPLDWLRDQSNAEGWLRKRAHLYLSGHVHRARSEETWRGSGSGFVTVAAGAAHEPLSPNGPSPRHGYNVSAVGWRSDGALVLRVWSRIWRVDEPGFTDNPSAHPEGRHYAEHSLDFPSRSHGSRRSSRSEVTGKRQGNRIEVRSLGAVALQEAGVRRTAYPSDLSFAELRDQDLHVVPHFVGDSSVADVAQLASALAAGNHALVLGEPGAGKSFASFLVLAELAKLGATALTLDLGELPEARVGKSGRRISRATVLRSIARRLIGTSATVDDAGQQLVLVIDGIDELLSTGADAGEIAADLSQLAKRGTLLVTCRIREYQTMLASRISAMGVVAKMRPWSSAEFSLFVGKLARAGRLADPTRVTALVESSSSLSDLVTRPLYARMLTFVMEAGESKGLAQFRSIREEIHDRASLYRAYLEHLAGATEVSMERASCPHVAVYDRWRDTVWWIFEEQIATDDGVSLTPLLDRLKSQGMEAGCAIRAFDTLVDTTQVFDELRARFLHFSFFEYLVGEEAARRLRLAAGEVAPLGSLDLTVEMRHFMMRIVNTTEPKDFSKRLVESYRRSTQLPLSERLVVNNLLAYILGRASEPDAHRMRELLAEENQPMLRVALYWALCGAGDQSALREFLKVLETDPEMASLNRGYLRYYYGDINQREKPPYRDDSPYGTWASTRRRTIEMISEADYVRKVAATRRVLDVATFVNFLQVREEELRGDEHATVATALQETIPSLSDLHTKETVEELSRRIGGPQLSWSL